MRLGRQGRVVGLRLVDEFLVMSEIGVAQFGVAIEAERFPDEGVELPDEEIGEVEGGELVLGAGREGRVAFEERVAVRAFDHLDAHVVASRLQ